MTDGDNGTFNREMKDPYICHISVTTGCTFYDYERNKETLKTFTRLNISLTER